MVTYWRSFRGFVAERARRMLAGVLMSLNDPQWGRRGNQSPPDLDELMRNFKQKLGSLFGGKGGGNGGAPRGPGLLLRIPPAPTLPDRVPTRPWR